MSESQFALLGKILYNFVDFVGSDWNFIDDDSFGRIRRKW